MFGGDNDAKLLHLEPVVVLERNKDLEQELKQKRIEAERPHRCSQCGERFHTSILLAVHKRIHIIPEEEIEDVDDPEPIENVCEADCDKRSQDPSYFASSVGNKNTSIEKFVHKKNSSNIKSPSEKNIISEKSLCGNSTSKILSSEEDEKTSSSQIIKEYNRDNEKDPLGESVLDSGVKIYHRDHDYALSADKYPAPIRNATEKEPEKNKKRRNAPSADTGVVYTCNQCPASFSRSWYLKLHKILLHFRIEKDAPVQCPQCAVLLNTEENLRQHIKNKHSRDLIIMTAEITTSLRISTDPLTGENKKFTKKKQTPEGASIKPMHIGSKRIDCDWKKACSAQQDEILNLVESELRHIVTERNKLGDHFSYNDIQRLGLQIANHLHISDFLYGNPSKGWAKRLLGSVGQIPRSGKVRFLHNVNVSYLNAVNSLSARGLSESTIFYAFEYHVCSVHNNQIVTKRKLSTVTSNPAKLDSVTAVICTNANGTLLLDPLLNFQGNSIDYDIIDGTETSNTKIFSGDFIESPNFKLWFATFLNAIPKARPVLVLVEGDVSQLPYSVILMARSNDAHLVFLPSRKRFVHPHQLIRKSLVTPLEEAFDNEISKFMENGNSESVGIQYMRQLFESSWKSIGKLEISKSFLQSGFLPLPQTTRPLEAAAREYLDEVLFSSHRETTSTDGTSESVSPVEPKKHTVDEDPPLAPVEGLPLTPVEEKVKLETVEGGLQCKNTDGSLVPAHVKEEPMEESDNDAPIDSILEVKQEPLEYNDSTEEIPMADRLEEFKHEYNCGNCNKYFDSNQDFSMHTCTKIIDGAASNYSCSTCDAEFKEEEQLIKHKCNLKLVNPKCDLHTCHICSMSFALKDTLDFHMMTHGSERHAGCSSSGQQSLDLSRYQQNLTNKEYTNIPSEVPLLKTTFRKRGALTDPNLFSKVPKLVSFDLPDSSASSSRTISPSSPASSRTLTASPGASDDEDFVKNEGNRKSAAVHISLNSENSIAKSKLIALPLNPLLDHDYLGLGHTYSNFCRALPPSSKEPRKPVFSTEEGHITIKSVTSSSHSNSTILSRKQAKKAFRRMALVSTESKINRRLRKK